MVHESCNVGGCVCDCPACNPLEYSCRNACHEPCCLPNITCECDGYYITHQAAS